MTDLDAPFSASKLKTFAECGERFRVKYVERLQGTESESIYLRMGDAVHDSIEAVLKRGLPLDDESLLADRFRAEYRESAYDFSDEEIPYGGGDPHEKVLRCLDNAATYLAKYEPSIIAVEAPVRFHHRDLDHSFAGFADLLTEGPDRVVDWKTGKADGKSLDETLQGAAYLAGYRAYTGRTPQAIQFVYLDKGEVHTIDQFDEAWETMTRKARAVQWAIENDEYQATDDDSKCHWCDYEVHCTASPVGGGNIDWRDYP